MLLMVVTFELLSGACDCAVMVSQRALVYSCCKAYLTPCISFAMTCCEPQLTIVRNAHPALVHCWHYVYNGLPVEQAVLVAYAV